MKTQLLASFAVTEVGEQLIEVVVVSLTTMLAEVLLGE